MPKPRRPRPGDRLIHRHAPTRQAYCLWCDDKPSGDQCGIVENELPEPLPDSNWHDVATEFGNWDLISENWRIATRQRTTAKRTIYPPLDLDAAIQRQADEAGVGWGEMAVELLKTTQRQKR